MWEKLPFSLQEAVVTMRVPAIETASQRFCRVGPARSRAECGAGVGLSMVQRLVAARGGNVEPGQIEALVRAFVSSLPRENE